MGITYGDHLIDSGRYEMTPEQEREILEDRMCDSVADDLRKCANEPWKYDGGSWPDKMIAGAAEIDRLRSELAAKEARIAELEEQRKELDRRIHNQRLANRDTWEIVEMRGNAMGSPTSRAAYLRCVKWLKEARADNEALRKQLVAEFGVGEDTTTMTRKSFAEVLQALADAQKELAETKAAKRDPCYYRGEQCGAQVELATLREQHSNVLLENECQRQELVSNKLVIDQLAHERNDTQTALEAANARNAELGGLRPAVAEIERNEAIARAERVEAECKAAKELVRRIICSEPFVRFTKPSKAGRHPNAPAPPSILPLPVRRS